MSRKKRLHETGAFRLDSLGEGVGALEFDLPGEKVNKLTEAVLLELDSIVQKLARETSIRILLLRSGKSSRDTFIAGADIDEIRSVRTPDEAMEKVDRAHQILSRLEALPQVTVAVIDGLCLGGGTELALACDYRVAADDPRTSIGLPEVNLGIIPGFGGTQRLPRLIGVRQALTMILTGKPVDARKAYKLGLVDRIAPAPIVNDAAIALGHDVVDGTWKPRPRRKTLGGRFLENTWIGRKIIRHSAERDVSKRTGGHYPAPYRALDAVLKGYGRSLHAGLRLERELVSKLVAGPVSKNLIATFQSSERLRRGTGSSTRTDRKQRATCSPAPRRVGIIGAGVMGGGIAALLVRKGFHVRMRDIKPESVTTAYREASKSFDILVGKRRMTRSEAANALAAISASTDPEPTGLAHAELVIEAVVEVMATKKAVLRQVEPRMSEDAVFATNTSSLSIDELAKAAQRPERVAGLHFFNPVHRMPLVEVVAGAKTSEATLEKLEEFSRGIGKYPLRVKNGPGFLVNRLLMPYLNEAAYLFEEGYRMEEIDRVAVDFGLPMGPFALLDEVGFDVAAKVAAYLHKKLGDRAAPAPLLERLTGEGLLGKKGGEGFYVYRGGKRRGPSPRTRNFGGRGSLHAAPERWIQRLLLPMVNEAAWCLEEEIVSEAWEVDIGMVMGTGFPPFRGGPLRWADTLGLDNVVRVLEELASQVGGTGKTRFEPHRSLKRRAQAGETFHEPTTAAAETPQPSGVA